jgi:hypothetical protein
LLVGGRCVVTCWALMLPMAIEHHPALMVGAARVLASERRRGPNPERRAGRRRRRCGSPRLRPRWRWSSSSADPSRRWTAVEPAAPRHGPHVRARIIDHLAAEHAHLRGAANGPASSRGSRAAG